jgi:hypothetical protein
VRGHPLGTHPLRFLFFFNFFFVDLIFHYFIN